MMNTQCAGAGPGVVNHSELIMPMQGLGDDVAAL